MTDERTINEVDINQISRVSHAIFAGHDISGHLVDWCIRKDQCRVDLAVLVATHPPVEQLLQGLVLTLQREFY